MKYEALVSFTTGTMNVAMGQIIEIDDEELANDLLQAGYIEEYNAQESGDVDLSDYIKYNDYAQPNHGGVITSGYGFNVNTTNGKMSVSTLSKEQYDVQANSYPISKGTLENVLNERLGGN